MPKHRYALVTCARWEDQTIVEWLEYHRSIGFEHVYLYSNDDDPIALLHQIVPYVAGSNPFVTYRFWPKVGDQAGMYLHFLQTHGHETEWCSFLDADEFFVFRDADNVDTFMAPYAPIADVVYFHWLRFGSGGLVKRQADLSLLVSHTRRQSGIDRHTKLLCRTALLDAAKIRAQFEAARGRFWYFLDNYDLPGARFVGVLGNDMKGYAKLFAEAGEALQPDPEVSREIIAVAYIAHFQIQAEVDFIRRAARGGFAEAEHWKSLATTGKFQDILAETDEVYDPYLATYWLQHLGAAACYDRDPATGSGQPRLVNVALNKPTGQSSVYRTDESTRGRVAVTGKANDGSTRWLYGFHTALQENPWIVVDLLDTHMIREIRVFNRDEDPVVMARARPLVVETSVDERNWSVVFKRSADSPDWRELTIPNLTVTARYVRLSLAAKAYFHLKEIEVFGQPTAG